MKSTKTKRIYLAAALAGLAVTLKALSVAYLYIDNYGSIGLAHQMGTGTRKLAVGKNNVFTNSSSDSATIGCGLKVNSSATLVVGKITPSPPPRLTLSLARECILY